MRLQNLLCLILLASTSASAQPAASPAQTQEQAPAQTQEQAPAQKKEQSTDQQKKPTSPAEANPFPQEKSQKAQDAANGATSESSSHAGYSSSHVDLKRFSPDASRESRISNGAGGYIHDPQMAANDDKVGDFYMQTGDFKGAYDRFKEATLVAPEDANAVFGLAQSARGLGLNKVAIANYTIYLGAVPEGKHAKDARKALKDLDKKK
jgi:hypothetical protein